MRAVAVDSVPEAPQVRDLQAPRPETGEVLVAVASTSVNGFDVAVAAGHVQGMMEHRFPLVLGKDFAGTITELGEGVEGFAVGDQVFGVLMKPVLQAGTLASTRPCPQPTGWRTSRRDYRCRRPERWAWPGPRP
jgi:NADPH:quinone reductase-like Zn-dependent oxidoreductase